MHCRCGSTKCTEALEAAQVPGWWAGAEQLGNLNSRTVSKTGRIADTRASHAQALKSAGIDHLTTHGLRRLFSLLAESDRAPAGAIAQVMGHRPSATAEVFRPRSVDALRPFLEQIEAHILNLAGVTLDRAAEPGKLRVVAE